MKRKKKLQNPENTLMQRYIDVVEHTTAMLAYWDKDLVCRFANNAYLDWFGIQPQEMIDKITLDKLLGTLYNQNLPYINEVWQGRKQVFERDIVTPSGKLRQTVATYTPDIVDGTVKGFFAHVSDVTPSEINVSQGKKHPAKKDMLHSVEQALQATLLTGFPGINALAQQQYISPSTLKRDFRKKYNRSIFAYYRFLQMEYAEKYIAETSCSRKQIATMLKFENPSNFSLCYHKYLQETATKRLIEKLKRESDEQCKRFINHLPFSIAMFDTKMNFMATSQQWITDHNTGLATLLGTSFYSRYPGNNPHWKTICKECVEKDMQQKDVSPLYLPDGTQVWLKWNIKPWYQSPGKTGGLVIFTEDVTATHHKESENEKILGILRHTTGKIKIGLWKRNFITGRGVWSNVLREILEVEDGSDLGIEPSMQFYKKGKSRQLVKKSTEAALGKGLPFDIEVAVITAKGNEKMVRVIGYPKFENGKCEVLMGILQDLSQ